MDSQSKSEERTRNAMKIESRFTQRLTSLYTSNTLRRPGRRCRGAGRLGARSAYAGPNPTSAKQ